MRSHRTDDSAEEYAAKLREFMCPSDKALLADLEARGVEVAIYDGIYFADPYYDGKEWVVRRFDAAGTAGGKTINIVRSGDVRKDARTLYHEGLHVAQPSTMSSREKEYEAYIKTEEWAIARGVPPYMDQEAARTVKDGRVVPNEELFKAFVDHMYPGAAQAPTQQAGTAGEGTAPQQEPASERIIGRTSDGHSIVSRRDGTTFSRPPREGDSYGGPEVTVPEGGLPVKISDLQCK